MRCFRGAPVKAFASGRARRWEAARRAANCRRIVRTVTAFEAPGYRWLWLSSLCTSAAYTVEVLSHGWLVLILTNSPFWVGMAVAVRGVSQTLCGVLAGVAADRLDRRRVLITTQGAAAAGAVVVGSLVVAHRIALWEVFVYLVLVGCTTAMNRPAINGLVYDVVGETRLLSASAYQFMAGSLVRVAGALGGGILIDRLGVGANWILIATVYGGAAASIGMLRPPAAQRHAGAPVARALSEGVRYTFQTARLRRLLLLSLSIEGFGFSTNSMLPVMARDVLRVGGIGLGYLVAMNGIGQFASTMLVARRAELRHLGTVVVVAGIGFGTFIVLFALSPWFALSLVLISIVGAMGTAYDTTMSTSFQIGVADAMRGRVLGLYSATFGLSSVGGLCIGAAATVTGTPVALALSGAAVVASGLGLLRRRGSLGRPADLAVLSDTT
jgi:MFS family permease